MTTKAILHQILLGMDAYICCGVPGIYWELAVTLMDEVYGAAGLKLMERYHKTYDDSPDASKETILHTINGWDDPNTEINPEEFIQKLEAL